MPYQSIAELPDRVKDTLPTHAQDIYRAAFNHAWEEYKNPSKRRGSESQEEVAHKIAWSAVEKQYQKQGGRWISKS